MAPENRMEVRVVVIAAALIVLGLLAKIVTALIPNAKVRFDERFPADSYGANLLALGY